MSGIGVIINPYSRAHKKNPLKGEKLGFIVGDKGSCHTTESLEDVRTLAREFKEKGVEVLGISGGDGTNHKTLTIFLEEYGEKPLPKIALLRGGTMNNLSTELGIKGDSEKILSNIIVQYHSGKELAVQEIDLLKVNGHCGFIFGCGVVSRFIEEYVKGSVEPSPTKGAFLLARAVISGIINTRFARDICKRFDAEITIDGKKAPFKNYTMLFAGTMKTLGFCFKPLYRARESRGMFQMVGISSTPRQLIYTFPSAMFARPSKSHTYYDEVGKKATIEFDEPQRYIIDGDFPEGEVTKIEMEIGPSVQFVIPTGL